MQIAADTSTDTLLALAKLPIGTRTPLAAPVRTADGLMTHLVTLAAGASYRPVNPAQQLEGRTGVWYAGPSRYVCDGRRYPGKTPVTHHGLWQDSEQARRFAVSMGESAVSREVPEYLYCPGFGVV